MAHTFPRTSTLVTRLLCSTAIFLLPNVALANPAGGQAAAGSATITQPNAATTTVTQRSEKAIIDWHSFSIGRGQTTAFKQPDAKAITLNRVTGVDPSKIAGSLTANGQVWLVNPNGIAFSKTARVDVAGLLATTIDISNKDFMSGNYHFQSASDPSAMVTNAGHITIHDAGLAALVAPGVANSGVIEANLGRVQLSSAAAFTVDLYGDGLFNITLDKQVTKAIKKADGTAAQVAVSNSGQLIANGGQILMTADVAKSVVDHAIDMTGYVQATSANVAQNGDIVLDGGAQGTVAVAGTLDASGKAKGQTGGTVDVTGQNVQLASTAKVDASGDAGGGTVHIGGDEHGAGPLRNASATSVASGATINANAVTSGNGGNVVVWSNDKTDYQGSISAKGGSSRGDGGSAEVSSHGLLNFSGTVDLLAPNGNAGTLLLDPQDVTIGSYGPWVVTTQALSNALANGNVLIQTDNSLVGNGDITFAQSFSWSGANNLTLSAYRNIIFDSGVIVSNNGSANLTLRADSTGIGTGAVQFLGSGGVNWSSSSGGVSIFYDPQSGYANPQNYSGSVSGNLTAYMLVNSAYDLSNIRNNLSGTYALGRNIDASGFGNFNPIGNLKIEFIPTTIGGFPTISVRFSGSAFNGMFDGQGHTITGLRINSSSQDFAGLFAYLGTSGAIRDVKLAQISVSASQAVVVGGLVAYNTGSISDATVSGSISGGNNVGGIVGINLGSISESASFGSISGGSAVSRSTGLGPVLPATDIFFSNVGGLVGGNSGQISQSFSTANVSDTYGNLFFPFSYVAEVHVGGLAGANGPWEFTSPTNGSIAQSYATGAVRGGAAAYAGGLVGWNDAGNLRETYSVGTVSGSGLVGGLVGREDYSTGVLGSAFSGTVNSSYWDTQRSGLYTSGAGNGVPTSVLQDMLPNGFDSSVWIAAAGNYPDLRWHEYPTQTTTEALQPISGTYLTKMTAQNTMVPIAVATSNRFSVVSNLLASVAATGQSEVSDPAVIRSVLSALGKSSDLYHKDGFIYAGRPSQECAVLVQALDNYVGGTRHWTTTQSDAVSPPILVLEPGAPIATFVRGPRGFYFPQDPPQFPGTKEPVHAGIFLGYGTDKTGNDGMYMLDQWDGHKAEVRFRRFGTGYHPYYVITGKI